MKRAVLGVWLAFLGVMLLGACASSVDRHPEDAWWYGADNQAVIRSTEGQVQVSEGNGEWRPGGRGTILRKGDRLRTGVNSEALVYLGERAGGVVRITPGSLVIFEQLAPADPNSEVAVILNLPEGRVMGDTLDLPAEKKILVKTPNGTHEIK